MLIRHSNTKLLSRRSDVTQCIQRSRQRWSRRDAINDLSFVPVKSPSQIKQPIKPQNWHLCSVGLATTEQQSTLTTSTHLHPSVSTQWSEYPHRRIRRIECQVISGCSLRPDDRNAAIKSWGADRRGCFTSSLFPGGAIWWYGTRCTLPTVSRGLQCIISHSEWRYWKYIPHILALNRILLHSHAVTFCFSQTSVFLSFSCSLLTASFPPFHWPPVPLPLVVATSFISWKAAVFGNPW